jgi:hypothetical protein
MNHATNATPQSIAPAMPIPAAMSSLGYEINALTDTAAEIAKRLSGLLMPASVPPGSAQQTGLKEVPRSTSVMTDDIEDQRLRIQAARDQLQDVLNRLEV